MKKTLLTSTALGLFAAGSAFAATPSVTVGGYADFQVGNADQAGLFETQGGSNSPYTRDLHTRTDTEIHISIDGKTDSGLGYGAYIELEADVNQDDSTGGNNNAERGYIYVETGFGRVEAGATGDAANALRVDASSFARATGGIGGDFYKYVDLGNGNNSGVNDDSYFILPGLPTAAGLPGEANIGDSNGAGALQDTDIHAARATANKISYYSPRVEGLQLGLSYTPDQGERGTARGFSGSNSSTATTTDFEDVWNIGLNYDGQFEDLGIEASVTAEWGDVESIGTAASTRDDLEAYAIGINLSYAGFTVGGSYGIADEFGQTTADGQELDYYTLGAAYEFGPVGTSITYMSSTVENQGGGAIRDKEFTNLSIGADYKLAPGLVPYVEVSFFDTDDNVTDTATTSDNDGTVIIVGTELSF